MPTINAVIQYFSGLLGITIRQEKEMNIWKETNKSILSADMMVYLKHSKLTKKP